MRFLVFGDPEELAAYRALVDAYEKKEPTADVQLVEASDRTDLIARLSTSIAGGSPPDLFLMNYRFYGQFAAKGAIEAMDERLRATDTFEGSAFYPQALQAFRWRGEQLCLPQNVSSLVVYFNRDLFRRFRVPDPRAGWTWNELVAKAGLLTRDARGRVALGGDPRRRCSQAGYLRARRRADADPDRTFRLVERGRARGRRAAADAPDARHAQGPSGPSVLPRPARTGCRAHGRGCGGGRRRGAALPTDGSPCCSPRDARRPRSERSASSTGTWRLSRGISSRPGSSTPTPTA